MTSNLEINIRGFKYIEGNMPAGGGDSPRHPGVAGVEKVRSAFCPVKTAGALKPRTRGKTSPLERRWNLP